jgi:hypothetical protein
MKCKLVVQIGPQSVVVARGQAYPPKDVVTVHGIERRDDHTKVQVDFVFGNFLDFSLPIPIAGGDMFTLGEAKNSFVLWPNSFVFVLGQPLVSSALLKRMGKQSQCFHKWYFAMTTPISRRQSATHFMVRYEEHDFLEKSGVYAVEFSDVFHIYNDLALTYPYIGVGCCE